MHEDYEVQGAREWDDDELKPSAPAKKVKAPVKAARQPIRQQNGQAQAPNRSNQQDSIEANKTLHDGFKPFGNTPMFGSPGSVALPVRAQTNLQRTGPTLNISSGPQGGHGPQGPQNPQASNRRLAIGSRQDAVIGDFQRASSSKGWGKSEAFISGPRQVFIDKNTNEAARKNKYLKDPAHNEQLNITILYAWTDPEAGPDTFLGDGLRSLDYIRKNCEVFIDFDSQSIRIRGKDTEATERGLKMVRLAVKNMKAEYNHDGEAAFFVDPPAAAIMTTSVAPRFKAGTETSSTPVVSGVTLVGHKFNLAQFQAWESKRLQIAANNRARLYQVLQGRMGVLQHIQSGMRMRLHFGHIEITAYEKGFKDGGYSLQTFTKMMAKPQIKSTLEKNVGNPSMASTVKALLVASPEVFSPADATTFRLTDLRPKHTLVMMVMTPSKDMIQIEAVLDKTFDGNKQTWQIGSVACFKLMERKIRLNIINMGFDNTLDWSLEIVTPDIIIKVPSELNDLLQNCGKPVPKKDAAGFTYPWVKPKTALTPDIKILYAWIRSVEKYNIASTPYIFESAVYRKWDGADTNIAPKLEYGLTLYNQDWEVLLAAQEEEREWGSELTRLFPGASFEDGLTGLMDIVQKIRGGLTHVNY